MKDVMEKFAARWMPEPNTGCWLWTGGLLTDGYGIMPLGRRRRQELAHRFSYEAFVGPVGALLVCHHCDTPACVNPDHLFLGTVRDNSADMVRKGRARGAVRRGEQNGYHKLTAQQVVEIRRLRGVVTQRELALRYGISRTLVSVVSSGKAWAWLSTPTTDGDPSTLGAR